MTTELNTLWNINQTSEQQFSRCSLLHKLFRAVACYTDYLVKYSPFKHSWLALNKVETRFAATW